MKKLTDRQVIALMLTLVLSFFCVEASLWIEVGNRQAAVAVQRLQ